VNVDLLIKARNLIHQLDRWWFENYEMAIDPAFEGQTIDEVEFVSMRMAFVDHVIGVAVEEV
jgi:hypothetical protein